MDYINLERWYQSMTMGNIVASRLEVLKQMIDSLFRFKTPDFKWRAVWLAPSHPTTPMYGPGIFDDDD